MTARDKAIESMVDATDYDLRYRLGVSGTFDLLGAMLDLIPPDVLAQLAIERGGLVEVGADVAASGRLVLWDEPYDDDADLLDQDTDIYRVVDQ